MQKFFGTIGGILLVVVCLALAFSLFTTTDTVVVLREIEAGKPIGIMTLLPMPVDPQTGLPSKEDENSMQARYVSLLPGGASIPATSGAPAKLVPSRDGGANDCGWKVVSAKMMFRAFMPTVVTAESGQKVYALTMGMYGVGESGCKNTIKILDADYDPKFQPDTPAESLWQVPGCLLRLFVGNPANFSFFDTKCTDQGFYPTQNWQDIGPTPDSAVNSVFVYCAYAGGIWAHSITNVIAPEVALSANAVDFMSNPVYNTLCPPQ